MSSFSDQFRESLGGHPEEMKMPPRPPIYTPGPSGKRGFGNIDRTELMAQNSVAGSIDATSDQGPSRPDFVATSRIKMIEGAKRNGPLPDVSHLPRDERNASADHVKSNWMRERSDYRKGAYTGYVRMPSVGDLWVR